MSLIFVTGRSKNNSEKEKFQNQPFLTAFQKGLTKRWDYLNKTENEEMEGDKHLENLEEGINKELEMINDFKNKKFKNPKLQEKALAYINVLNDSLEIVQKKIMTHIWKNGQQFMTR